MPIRELVESSYEDLWNRQDPSRLHDILTPSFSFRGSLGVEKTGPEEFWDYVRYVVEPLGDYRCDIEVVVSGGQRALAKMWFSGIHRGELLGFQPTGKRVGWAGAVLFRRMAASTSSGSWATSLACEGS